MTNIIRVEQPDDAPLHIVWVINNICTNSCSYCPPFLHTGKNHHYNWEKAKIFLRILFNKHKKIHCTVVGGEPSVSPFFPEFVKLFYDAGHTLTVGSNAAKPVSFWKDVAPYVTNIGFTYHPEFPDKDFFEKAVEAGKLTDVSIRVMMHPKYWDHCIDIIDQLKKLKHIKVQLPVRVINWGGGSDSTASVYTPEQMQWFEDIHTQYTETNVLPYTNSTFVFDDGTVEHFGKPTKYINLNKTNFFGYECDIGLRSLVVEVNGNIRRGNCHQGDVLGNLSTPENISWPTDPLICRQTSCTCGVDVRISKRKI